jgi:hypothetical protein
VALQTSSCQPVREPTASNSLDSLTWASRENKLR